MKITYFALVSFDEYVPGDIIPGAAHWPYIQHYVSEGRVAPVLVATLPEAVQDKLSAWADENDPDILAARRAAEAEAAEIEAAQAAEAEAAAAAEAAAQAADEDEEDDADEELSYAEMKAVAEGLELEFPGNISKVDLAALIADATTPDE